MRFVWAVVAFVLAVACVGAGIAQRTIFLGPSSHQEQLAVDETQHYTLVDAAVLAYLPGSQTLKASNDSPGDVPLFAAYGRTADMVAWLADTSYNHVTLNEPTEGDKTISSTVVEPVIVLEPDEPEADEASEDDAATDAPADEATAETDATDGSAQAPESTRNPAGSDLWIAEFSDAQQLIQTFNLPTDMSVLIATDGTTPAPADISVTWAVKNDTPWAGPLVVLGGLFAIIGVVLYILGIRHMRRKRGPRRRGLPPLPVTEPLSLAELEEAEGKSPKAGASVADKPAETAGVADPAESAETAESPEKEGRAPMRPHQTPRRSKRFALAVPALLASSLVLAGCTADAWPQFGEATPTPTPTPTVVAPQEQKPPVLLEAQATRILTEIAANTAAADEANDAALAAERLDGAALAARETNYTLRAANADYPALSPVPSTWTILLPQAADTWPRSFLAVSSDETDETVAPIMMMATQADPWSAYKLDYVSTVAASAALPKLAPAYIGATLVNPDSAFLMMPPENVAAMYSDIIENGEASEYAELYDLAGDAFRPQVIKMREDNLAAFKKTAEGTGEMTFASVAGDTEPVALATLSSGAIIAVSLNLIEEPRSTNADATIRVDEKSEIAVLAGKAESATGFKTTRQVQLFFFVPAQGSNEQIRLLGETSSILNAEVLK